MLKHELRTVLGWITSFYCRVPVTMQQGRAGFSETA
jgi:hypothetical protein